MADTAELGSLVTRLLGDTSSYINSLNQAMAATKQFATTATTLLSGVGFAASLGGALAGYAQAERAQLRLNAAIEAGGNTVDAVLPAYQKFADELARNTTIGRQQALGLFAQAEAMGVSGDAAKQLVQTAIALAARNGGAAESFLRIANLIKEGHPELARRYLGLQGIKSQTELVTKIQERLRAGWAMELAAGKSTTAQLERLTRSFAELSREVGGLVAEYLMPLVRIVQEAVDVYKALDPSVRRTVAAFAAGVLALGLLRPALAVINALMGVLFIRQAANLILTTATTGAWLAWRAVVAAVNLVMVTFNALQVAFGFLMKYNIVQVGVYLVLLGLVKGAVAILSVVFGALNLVLSATNILAFATTLGLVALTLSVVASAAIAAYQTAKSLFEVLGNMPTLGGPLRVVGDVFREWGGILYDVFRAAQVNLPLAWKLLQAGAVLAVAQVRDLFPPLWSFIQAGFSAVADFVSFKFRLSFYQAMVEILLTLTGPINRMLGISQASVDEALARMTAKADQATKTMGTILEMRLKAALNLFDQAMMAGDSDAVEAARANVKAIQTEIDKAAKADPFGNWAAEINAAATAYKRFDAALFGSGEAARRIQENLDAIAGLTGAGGGHGGKGGHAGGGAAGHAGPGGVPFANVFSGSLGSSTATPADDNRDLLTQIRDYLQKMAAEPQIVFDNANVI